MGSVVEMYPGALDAVGSDAVIAPDTVLENNKGAFARVFIVGTTAGDELILAGSHSIQEMYIHLGLAMREIEDRVTGKK